MGFRVDQVLIAKTHREIQSARTTTVMAADTLSFKDRLDIFLKVYHLAHGYGRDQNYEWQHKSPHTSFLRDHAKVIAEASFSL
jgi:hypothetical protein